MRTVCLLFALVLALGACGSPDPPAETDAGAPIYCDDYYGPVSGPDAGVTECERGDICIQGDTKAWVCAPGEAILCNSETGAGLLPPGAKPEQEAGDFLCFPGYRCLNPTDGTGFQCYPPTTH